MNDTLLLTHADCLAHDPGQGHPESPARLAAVLEAIAASTLADLPREEPPLADPLALALAHTPSHVKRVFASIPRTGWQAIDADTVVSSRSGEAACRAAGAVMRGIDAVFEQEYRNVFCAVRPPGHHAERERAMGFCLFNAVAIGACHALQRDDCTRVAIVDFDVHHGNGTQDIFCRDSRVLYASSHQMPLYPGTGGSHERGVDNIVNVPLPPGAGSTAFRRAYTTTILPAVRAFAPDLLLISAGFDAHARDPLAGINLETEDFAWVTGQLVAVAEDACRGRLVSTLEGGYNLDALAASAVVHLQVLSGTAITQ